MNLRELVNKQSVPDSEETVITKQNKAFQKYGPKKLINGYDFDGVITAGLIPREHDVIITGRSFCMAKETYEILNDLGIKNPVYFNPQHRGDSTRESSGEWKSLMISKLLIDKFFEDDPVQANVIKKNNPNVTLVYIISDVFKDK